MDIFLSWSGEQSKNAADSFSKWLPKVIQTITPYFTPLDINKGDRWATEIAKKLDSCQFGIIFLTKENLKSEWILFEAGALSKNLEKARLCIILVDKFLTPDHLSSSPLRQFQMTMFNKEDIYKLLKSINYCLDEKALSESLLNNAFETNWSNIEKDIEVIFDNKYFGVKNILPKFSRKKFISLIEDSKDKIILLNTWVPCLDDFEISIKEALKKGVDVEILLLHPNSQIVELRDKTLGKKPGQVKNGVNSNIEIIQNIAKDKQDNGSKGKIFLRLYNTIPAISIFQVDDTIYVSIFAHEKLAIDSPQIVIVDDKSDMKEFIVGEYNAIWSNNVICKSVDDLINITKDDLDRIANSFGL